MGSLPADESLEEVLVRIKTSYSNPSVRRITHVVLKEGPKTFRIATLMEVMNASTGQLHHHHLKIDQIKRTKEGWFATKEKSIGLEGTDPNEIRRLYTFLEAALKGKLENADMGEVHLVRREDYAKLEQLLKALPNLTENKKLELLGKLLAQFEVADSTMGDFVAALEGSSENALRQIAVASRFIEYRAALDELRALIDSPDTKESQFQKHLEKNPWMFGSEYSALLSRRTWTRDDRLDYMLRLTVDNYVEIIEIKTAFREPLFIFDTSRSLHYPSAKLAAVIGQVMRYIEEVERNRDHILAIDGVDTLKICARVIVGREYSTDQKAALRNLNSHLHRIEILTFDQLIRIAERVLSIFEAEDRGLPPTEPDEDIPF